jgi:hypothetical protein
MDDVFTAAPSGAIWQGNRRSAPAGTDASRYFAAAAYRDGSFRRNVLDFVRHSWYRASAPEFGINQQLVVDHCRSAERREHIRDLAMVLVFLGIAHTPMAWLISEPAHVGEIIVYFAPKLILAVLAAGLVLFIERLVSEHYTTARQFRRESFASVLPHDNVAVDEHQNLVVYGGYSPFVGSGYPVGGWSFSVNLERTRDEYGQPAELVSFGWRDLMRFVESRLDRLRIDGLRHYEVLFADGRLVRDNAATLVAEGRPKRQIPMSTIALLEDSPAAGTRSYLCINVKDWSGEIVLSIFLRCKKGESNLFVEASYFLVAPPKRDFFKIDETDPQLRVGTVVRILTLSTAVSAVMLVAAVVQLLAWAQAPVVHWFERRRICRAMRRNPRFNFGAVTSIRELGMENYYRVYFQQLDKERHLKTIEQCAIDAIIEFLDAHNVDTSDIRDRRSAILNNGVIVAGGDLNAGNMAVGSGAKAVVSGLGATIKARTSAQPQSARSAA